jgi:Rap1a immunity proteins
VKKFLTTAVLVLTVGSVHAEVPITDIVTVKECIRSMDYVKSHAPITLDDPNYVDVLVTVGACTGVEEAAYIHLSLPPNSAEICPNQYSPHKSVSEVANKHARALSVEDQSEAMFLAALDALETAWPCKRPLTKLTKEQENSLISEAAGLSVDVARCAVVVDGGGQITKPKGDVREHLLDAGRCRGVMGMVLGLYGDQQAVCLPDNGISRQQLYTAVFEFVKRNPPKRASFWQTAVGRTLATTWPCPKK